MLIFDLDGDGRGALAQALAADLDLAVSPLERRSFEDGECKLRPLVDPRGDDAYVVHALHGEPGRSPHDKLCALLMFVATLRDHGARRVSAVLPYLAYARKDRRTKPFDPLNQRYVAQLLEAMGTDQALVLEAHNLAALENAFRRPVRHLSAHAAFDAVAQAEAAQALVVASPDPGGVKRAQLWRDHLQARLQRPVGFAMVDKARSAGVVSGGELVAGAVEGTTVLMLDDLIATGGTLLRAARALRDRGARRIVACAAHGLFVEPDADALADGTIDELVVTDSVPLARLGAASPLRGRLRVVSCVPLFAQALRESHASWSR